MGGAASAIVPQLLIRGAGFVAGEVGAVALGAEAGSVVPGIGTAIGAAIGGLVAGSMALSKALSPHNDYMLMPFRHEETDADIGRMREVQKVLDEFNAMGAQHDYTDAKIQVAV